MINKDYVIQVLNELYPNAFCELIYHNHYELLVAIMLSAQTTDKAVNKVTPILFSNYPTIESLSNANFADVLPIIKKIGLANSKTKNIIQMAQMLEEKYQGKIPCTKEELIKLPGVGTKTANVYLAVGLGVNAFAVDTHVLRVANRLGISKSDNPLQVEKDLMSFFADENWIRLHHQFIFFGRYHCKAKNPVCDACKFNEYCHR